MTYLKGVNDLLLQLLQLLFTRKYDKFILLI